MRQSTGFYPAVHVDDHGTGIVSQAGATVLLETIKAVGLDHQLRAALAPWKKPFAWHDPAKIVLDQVISLATGGDCLADVDRFRNQPGALFGQVASLPTVTRLLADLASDRNHALAAINQARSVVRANAWQAAGSESPVAAATADDPLIIDIDATLVTSHSDTKEQAAGTYKKGFGFHPINAYVDHGCGGTGEGLAIMLRPGNAAANKAADHITVTRDALNQLPEAYRTRAHTLIRTDSAGGTRQFLNWVTHQHHNLAFSVGFPFTEAMTDAALHGLTSADWIPAIDSTDQDTPRDGAWVADITDHLDLSSWPAGMRVIVRKERPHPGAQLRITDIDGLRYTAFATNQTSSDIAALELRHRRRARCEDRIRHAKDTGLTNLPLQSFAANEIWTHLVMLACELTAYTQMLAFNHSPARAWEPKRLRTRIFATAGKLIRTGRRRILHLAQADPENTLILTGIAKLRALTAPS